MKTDGVSWQQGSCLSDSHYCFIDSIYDESGSLKAGSSRCVSEPSKGQTTMSIFKMEKETTNDRWLVPKPLRGQKLLLACIVLFSMQTMVKDRHKMKTWIILSLLWPRCIWLLFNCLGNIWQRHCGGVWQVKWAHIAKLMVTRCHCHMKPQRIYVRQGQTVPLLTKALSQIESYRVKLVTVKRKTAELTSAGSVLYNELKGKFKGEAGCSVNICMRWGPDVRCGNKKKLGTW